MSVKVELLAPAGNMQCLKAAIHAGADAVYVGGSQFGARAYADNFDEEELCEAIEYVHLFQKKIYLTLNTLLKDSELEQVYAYILPFYKAGLDGVIVQDFGVLKECKQKFPGMEVHASTQMTVTGAKGAKLLKQLGVCRVVPARELSLSEIEAIKKDAQTEVECFIHGAMCYSYSGQCLFSSFLGGRSGNRGRCAGPCRLPYQVLGTNKKEEGNTKAQYPISLKDLCALPILPKLLKCKIDSFKIEGRMKSPEYVAGVTSIYRKYIDRYESGEKDFIIEEKDLDLIRNLYIRGGMETGYYEKHNGKSMITLEKGSYENAVSDYSAFIKKKYVEEEKKIKLRASAYFYIDKPAMLSVEILNEEPIYHQDSLKQTEFITVCSEQNVSKALNRPMTEEDIRKQLMKTGNTPFEFKELTIEKDSDIFMPNKVLNELRRLALEEVRKERVSSGYRKEILNQEADEYTLYAKKQLNEKKDIYNMKQQGMAISISSKSQLLALWKIQTTMVCRLYLPLHIWQELEERQNEQILSDFEKRGIDIYLSFAPIVRRHDCIRIKKQLEELRQKEAFGYIKGFLLNNLEIYALIKEMIQNYEWDKKLIADYGFYCFNKKAADFLYDVGIEEMTAPLEWSRHEYSEATQNETYGLMEMIVYGYLPLMETANCIYKTMGQCKKEGTKDPKKAFVLEDRYKKNFQVITDCVSCRNTILNSVPLSLHKEFDTIKKWKKIRQRLMFTTESEKQMEEILTFYEDLWKEKEGKVDVVKDFTTGHFRKGVL